MSLKNLKHKLILRTMYGLGLRASEIVNLKASDIDFDRNTALISDKRNKQRQVMLPVSLKSDLQKYTELEKLIKYVFPGRKGKVCPESF